MAERHAILAIDQGTTSSRAMVFDSAGSILAVAQAEFPQIYPDAGWVEHDPEAIWKTTITAAKQAVAEAGAKGDDVSCVGITNQRETTLVWDRKTGEPIHNAIVWQDRRTAQICADLRAAEHVPLVRERTGLLLDPYFSATKIAWILDHVPGARARAEAGELAFGTVDSFLIWRLTEGKVHATDATNASRTSLFNIHTNDWDEALLAIFRVPRACLPQVKDCAADFGMTATALFGRPLPITGVAGDQQAAAIGQAGFAEGAIKSTYGTGCFVLVNTGQKPVTSGNNLLTTISYRLNGETTYALEGSIFSAGASVQWLRDELGIIKDARETEALAQSLDGNQGVYVVPAFAGLGAPHWRADARGLICGLSRGSGRAAIARATLESVAYQTADLLSAMQADGVVNTNLRVDGGMVANDWMLQFLADILQTPVERPTIMETTALGAAFLAGLQMGYFDGLDDIARRWQRDVIIPPTMKKSVRDGLLAGWQQAVRRALAP
ncbi:MAG: glycerol kinase GlpK [Pseudomonadota bacterium]